jgi:oligoendopeptidase F
VLRQKEASNAGYPDYRSYRWQQLKRFDYTPDDAKALNRAVEEVVAPVVAGIYERRRQQLGVATLRPWDLRADVLGRPPLRPFQTAEELILGIERIFHQLDPALGGYVSTIQRENLLDVEQRLNKAPIGVMMFLPASRRPFIFFEAAGRQWDVETLLHEGGHAAHVFEASHLPRLLADIADVPMEFLEVGSMAMEFLGEPYLTRAKGGFYSEEEVVRARIVHIEDQVLASWCDIARGDALQHWVYEHPEEATDAERVDQVWADLSRRYLPGVDWSGLEQEQRASWQNIPHFFELPFYFIEYAIALLGAVQIAANARHDEREAVRRYRHALALGGTRPLPELFAAAGARFAFDSATFRSAVASLEEVVAELEASGEY